MIDFNFSRNLYRNTVTRASVLMITFSSLPNFIKFINNIDSLLWAVSSDSWDYLGKIWDILEKLGIFWKNLEYFGKTWYILEKFGILG